MRRVFALGLAVWLATAGLLVFPVDQAIAQDGPILGEAPYLADGATIAASGTDIVAAAAVPSVDTSSRAASASFYYSYYTGQAAIGWTGSHASCNAGTTSTAFKESVINRVAYYRAMAGVPSNIGVAVQSSASNQQASLMFSRNNQLSHSPSSSWACYTSSGAQAAASSNIALGAYGVGAVDAYMKDAGGGNAAAGHRRWLLFPQTQSFGTGDIPSSGSYSSANSIWVWDSNVNGPRPSTRDGYVAWPPAGYVPYQVVFPRWTFSYPGANFGGASVTITLAGSNVPVTIDSSTATGYGENTIVFRLNGMADWATWENPGTDKTYTVRISGVNIGGSSQTFTYSVTVFDPGTSAPPPTATTTRTVTATPTRTPTRTATTVPGASTSTPTLIPGGFAIGEMFMVTNGLSLRSGPGTSYGRLAVMPSGTIGQVTGSPVYADGYWFYPITVSGYGSGWAAGEYFAHTPATATPTSTPAATSTPNADSTQPVITRVPGEFIPGDVVRPRTSVNLRSGPSTSTAVVAVVPSSASGTITGLPIIAGGLTWYPVTFPGYGSGWMAGQYFVLLEGADEGPPPTATSTAVSGYQVGAVVYTTAGLNIRTGPSTGYSPIGVAPKGTAATITGAGVMTGSVTWYPLNVPGIGNGWASGTYLSLTPTVQGPQLPTPSDPSDEYPEDEPTETVVWTATPEPTVSATSTPVPTEPLVPTEPSEPTQTPVVTDEDELPPTETPEPDVSGPQLPTETAEPEPTEGVVLIEPPAWLPVERIQRSPNSDVGQVLVDQDQTTTWYAEGLGQPLAMFVLDMGQETAFSQITWLTGPNGLSGTIYLAVSSDGENWVDLDPTAAYLDAGGWSVLDTQMSARYIRFVFVNDAGAEWLGGISEVRIMP